MKILWGGGKKQYRKGCDIAFIYGNPFPVEDKWCHSTRQYSLISDLEPDETELKKRMTKTLKKHINRAGREGVEISFYLSGDVLKDRSVLDRFSGMYARMYESKGLGRHVLDQDMLLAYARADRLLLSSASIEGETVVFHAYIYDEGTGRARSLFSCSEFRTQDKDRQNAIGRANRYLHWRDWLWFKERRVFRYDWGGLASPDEPNGIDTFKMDFGGEVVEYYNIAIITGFRAKLVDWIRKIKKDRSIKNAEQD